MSYLTYNPTTSSYPNREWENPNFIESKYGTVPPYVELTYASNGDTNGVFYYLGTSGLTVSFVNPTTNGEVTITAISDIDATRNKTKVADRGNASDANIWHAATSGSYHWLKVCFNNGSLALNKAVLQASYAHSFDSNVGDVQFHGSNDNITYELIGNKVFTGAAGTYNSFDTTLTPSYKYIRLTRNSASGWFILGELELYGQYSTD